MTTLELSINIIIILLLPPAIYYTAKLSNQLSKAAKQQKEMSELAQALIYAVNKLDKQDNETLQSTPEPQETVSQTVEVSAQPNEDLTPSSTPRNEVPQETKTLQEEPLSEAEKELLMALRSIK